MLKVSTNRDNKSFTALVKMVIWDDNNNLVGLGVASNLSTTRAVFASLYDISNSYISFENEKEGRYFNLRSTRSYRRLEELNGKVSHSFFLPSMAVEKDFEEKLQHAEQHDEAKPERIIIKDIREMKYEVGLFLANTYGLPRTREWAEKYIDLLPSNKVEYLNVITTELMGEGWENTGAVRIHSMHESEVI